MQYGKFWGALVAAGAIATAAGTASADTFRLSIGAGHPASAAWIASMQDFLAPEITKRVKERTGHDIVWTEAWGGSVCKLGECLEAVEAGLLDVADLQTPFDPSKLQAHNFMYFVPFGLSDPRQGAEAAREVYERVPELKTYLEENYNQVFLGVGIIGNYGLSSTFDWSSVDDLQGEKIAAAGPNIPWLEGTGIVGVQSNLNDAYTSLQTGVYNGWVMFAVALVSFKLIEVAENFADIGFGTISTPLVTINKDTWDGLPPEVQEIFLEVGGEWNAYLGNSVYEKQEAALQTMRDAGVNFIEVTDEDRKGWADRLPNLPKIRFEEIEAAGQPAEAIYTFIEVAEELGHTFPRDWAAER
jgi:TRAP-type C4-dicarboxylate transport system substrate-binding protein